MKKSLKICIIFIMLATFIVTIGVGCKTTTTSTTTAAETTVATETTVAETTTSAAGGAKKIIGLSLAGRNSLAFIAGEDYIKRTADQKGIFVTTTVAESDSVKQSQDIDDLIARGVNSIIAIPVDSKAIVSSIVAAHKAGIPFIAYNRMEDPNASEKSDAFVGQDTVAQAYDGAVELSKILEADGVKPENVSVLHVEGDLKDENALSRIEGFKKAAAEFGWKIVAEVPSEWNPDKALNGVTNALQANKDINVIFLASDFLWPAVKTAMQTHDVLYPRGNAKHIYVCSQDVFPIGYQDVKNKLIDVDTVFDVGAWSVQAVEIAEKLMNGEKLTQSIYAMRGAVATFDNIDKIPNLWGKEYQ